MQEGGRDEMKEERGITAPRYFKPFKETDREMATVFVGLHFQAQQNLRVALLTNKLRTHVHYGMVPL